MEKLAPGVYIVAVSGGVDSMVLVDMLRQQRALRLVVAHVNHGMRPDAAADETFVRHYAKGHGLEFVSTQLNLGAAASEATARTARYNFLRSCSKKYNAIGIVTAHHQDDMLETALLTLLRGTGWRGVAPFSQHSDILRPLLSCTKNDILAYARRNSIAWREDTTNTDESYARNYIRHTLIPICDQKSLDWRDKFLQRIRKQQDIRKQIEPKLTKWLDTHSQKNNNQCTLRRYDIIMAPAPVAYELFQQMCRLQLGHSLERPLAERALLFIKTGLPDKVMLLGKYWQLRAQRSVVVVERRASVVSYNKQ